MGRKRQGTAETTTNYQTLLLSCPFGGNLPIILNYTIQKTPNIVTDLEEIKNLFCICVSKVCTENLNIAANIKLCCLFVTMLVKGD